MSFFTAMGVIAGLAVFIDFGLYILSIFGWNYKLQRISPSDRSKPSRATWFIWTLLGVTITVNYYNTGATDTLPSAIMYAIGYFTVAICSIFYGENHTDENGQQRVFNLADKLSMLGAFLCVLVWLQRSAEFTLYATLIVYLFGACPTFIKTWKRPWSEDKIAWTATVVGNGFNVLAVDWRIAGLPVYLYPLFFFVVDGIVALFTYRRVSRA